MGFKKVAGWMPICDKCGFRESLYETRKEAVANVCDPSDIDEAWVIRGKHVYCPDCWNDVVERSPWRD